MSQVATRTPSASAVAALGGLKAGLQNVQSTLVVSGGDPYLRLLKDGGWVYGAENVECTKTDEWAINPLSLMHGWSCWTNYDPKEKKKNELLGERMVSAQSELPPQHTLPDMGDWDWKQQFGFQVQCVSGDDEGQKVLYKTNSVGGVRAVNDIIGAIMKQANSGTDAVVPVVLLKSDHYQHPSYGKTYFPVLEIVRWMTLDGTEQSVEEIQEAEAAAAEAAAEAKTETAAKPRGRSVPETGKEKTKTELLREQLAAAEAEEAAGGGQPAAAADPAPAGGGERLRRRRNA